ncbi:MAG: type II toxin-antitoxin system RelE family toxin [bacterium]
MKIYFSKKAEKYLLSLPLNISTNILNRIELIPKGDIKHLKGRKNEYRLRIGKFRILFFISKEEIYIFKIDSRGDIYK